MRRVRLPQEGGSKCNYRVCGIADHTQHQRLTRFQFPLADTQRAARGNRYVLDEFDTEARWNLAKRICPNNLSFLSFIFYSSARHPAPVFARSLARYLSPSPIANSIVIY